jgi:polar amino acid transport system substrate-binding protein
VIRKTWAAAAVASLAVGLAGCGDAANTKASVSGFTPRDAGVLTVGTELPNPPFLLGANTVDEIKDQGYEVEMVNEIAKRLGNLQVKWVTFPFTGLIAGKPCPCYFTAQQALVVLKGKTIGDRAAVKGLQLGVTQGSSGAFFVENDLKPTKAPRVYNNPTLLKLALNAGQVDAGITDVPIALDFQNKSTNLAVVGRFESSLPEEYGAVLKKNSPNTKAVTTAIDAMKSEGFFAKLAAKYFPAQVKIATLK